MTPEQVTQVCRGLGMCGYVSLEEGAACIMPIGHDEDVHEDDDSKESPESTPEDEARELLERMCCVYMVDPAHRSEQWVPPEELVDADVAELARLIAAYRVGVLALQALADGLPEPESYARAALEKIAALSR